MRQYQPGVLTTRFPGDSYVSPEFRPGLAARLLPSVSFYVLSFLRDTHWLTSLAAKGLCDDTAWCFGSSLIADDCETSGMRFHIHGMDVLRRLDGPCVIVANHMSTLETYILPCILRPHMPVTFIVKRSLTEMPFFGAVMRSRDPVVVDRKNPREDLTTILRQGCERLAKGVSIVVFPQSTRALRFDPAHFNTIGEMLARRAGVPVVPLALRTDAWGQGRKIKELGKIDPSKDVLFRFFEPIMVRGSGHAEHKAIVEALLETLRHWEERQKAKDEGRRVPPVVDPAFRFPAIGG